MEENSSVNEMNQLLEQTRDSGNKEAAPIAQSIAESIGISAESFAGREKDALPSLVGVAAYYKLSQREREAVLRYTAETFGMDSKFFARIQQTAIMQVVQPDWFKTNLSNDELKRNAILWGQIRIVVNLISGVGGSAVITDKVIGGENTMKRDWRSIMEKLKSNGTFTPRQLRIIGMSYVGAFLGLAAAIANGEANAMVTEVELRIDRGQMKWEDYRKIQKEIKNVMWAFE